MKLQKRTWKDVGSTTKLVPIDHDPVTCCIVRIPCMAGSGMQFVAAQWKGLWHVYEHTVGLSLTLEGSKTQADAVKAATKRMEQYGKEYVTKVFREQKAML